MYTTQILPVRPSFITEYTIPDLAVHCGPFFYNYSDKYSKLFVKCKPKRSDVLA